MAHPVLVLGALIAAVLVLSSGKAQAKPGTPVPTAPPRPTNQQCLTMIARALLAKVAGSPAFAYYLAELADSSGQTETAACLRQLAQNPATNCLDVIVGTLSRDLTVLGDPTQLRAIAVMARARGLNDLANCYEQMAQTVEAAKA